MLKTIFHRSTGNNSILGGFIVLIVYILGFSSHLPFLSADADLNMAAGSRGAWTDEGLNTSQIRNFINHNLFDLLECDNFLKTPFFSLYLAFPFKLFGTSLEVARFAKFSLVLLLLFLFSFRKTIIQLG